MVQGGDVSNEENKLLQLDTVETAWNDGKENEKKVSEVTELLESVTQSISDSVTAEGNQTDETCLTSSAEPAGAVPLCDAGFSQSDVKDAVGGTCSKSNDIHLSIRMPNGTSFQAKFSIFDNLRSVKNYVDDSQGSSLDSYDLAIPYPHKVFGEEDLIKTFSELGFTGRQAIIVIPKRQVAGNHRGPSSSNNIQSTTSQPGSDDNAIGYFGYLKRVLSYMNPFSYFGGGGSSSSTHEQATNDDLWQYLETMPWWGSERDESEQNHNGGPPFGQVRVLVVGDSGVIFVHDLSQRRTKASLQNWAVEIAATGTFSSPHGSIGPGGLPVPYLVVANKADIASRSSNGSSSNLVNTAQMYLKKQGLLSRSEALPLTDCFPGSSSLLAAAKEARYDKEAVMKFFRKVLYSYLFVVDPLTGSRLILPSERRTKPRLFLNLNRSDCSVSVPLIPAGQISAPAPCRHSAVVATAAATMDPFHDHRRHARQLRLSVPHRYPAFAGASMPSPFPFSPSVSAPTPSKLRRLAPSSSSSSFSSLLLLLFTLRSFYSLLPFIRSGPSSSLFPFSFLVSLLSFLISLPFSFPFRSSQSSTIASPSLLFSLGAKSALLSLVFLLRFQSLRYCSAAASILADFSGTLVARSITVGRLRRRRGQRILGFASLSLALILLSYSWDRIGCFPLSSSSPPAEGCGRLAPMLLPFLSGFLGFYERAAGNSAPLRQLGKKRTRLASLALTTVILFFPASISFFKAIGGENESSVSVSDLGWPFINTVIFGVVLNENFAGDEKMNSTTKDFHKEFLVTFFCTLVLELIYFPKLSLPGFLSCGFLLWVSVWQLGSSSFHYIELGSSESPENLYSMVMNPIRHILSERKTRKIALFLLINTAYMIVEFVVGFMSNSLGLISDACHMLFDCAALVIGLYASYISRLPANNQFNYGRGRFEVLSGYANAVFLVLVGALIVLESMERILDPQEISTNSLLAVSIGGLLVNVIGLIFFHEEHHHSHGGSHSCSHSHSHSKSNSHSELLCSHHHYPNQHDHCDHDSYHHKHLEKNHCDEHQHEHEHGQRDEGHDKHGEVHQNILVGIREEGLKMHYHIDHNMEGIFLHVLADTMGSIGVVISTLLIKYKGWLIADPACSIFISVMIVSSVVPLLRNSTEILLQRIPRGCEKNIRVALDNLRQIQGVCAVQNLHIWNFTNTETVGTVHLHVSTEADKALIKRRVSALFHEAGVKDITIQR
ncbi:Metal tolerance protein 8 [Apostasia shenzhenica]|uniref:Metal tolerance protein 8 n=1 Tax=Apostasia shenzhenica TaxID=1088818 RepID=A0A2I0B6M0_9ASPA|nr:Metal tolerance protein 8 [Apostasia shenzhenica]